MARFKIPPSAGKLAFTVGNYTSGVACGDQTPMNWFELVRLRR